MEDPRLAFSMEQTAALLSAAVHTLRAELEPLGKEAMRWHPAPGEWCANEVLGHLLEAERRGFAGRIQGIVAQPGRLLEDWDPEALARQRRDCERDGLELLREFEAVREESVRMVTALGAEQLRLSGEHPRVGELRVVELLHEWLHHDRNHVKQILDNVQSFVWPYMGNTRRFSSD
jgi:hypothetical protein